ncbi:MAG: molybdopterin-dependent oxidoreductase, partial [Bacteroides sp.]
MCRSFCTGACLLNLHIRDGKLMRTSMREMPEECYNRICLKGYTHPYREYSPKRILNPMRRAGERGEGKWEQITWDEAIAEIAEKWKAITDQYGPSAMACYTGPAGNRGAAGGNGSGALLTRFKKAVGMTTVNSAVDGAGNYAPSRMLGGSYFRVANEIKDIINAKTIFIWGACPSVSQVHNVHFITEARSKGAKVITIDPLYNANASIADQYVPLRAGTDGALALGMMNAVVENGWVDTEFITKHSVAPFLVKPDTHKFLRLSDLGRAEAKSDADKIVVMGKDGTVDIPENIPDPVIEGTFDVEGQSVITAYTLLLERIAEWPVERAAGITGISAADIVELTRTMCVDSPTTIYTVFGADHYYNGHWNYTCMTALAILTGNLGKPGAGFCGSASAGTLYQNLKEVSNVPCPIEKTQSLPAYSMAETILTGTHNGKPFDLRGLFVNFGDPVAN